MKDLAAEGVEAWNFRVGRTVELAGRSDQDARQYDVALGRFDLPEAALFVERRAQHLRVKTNVLHKSILGDAVLLVAVNVRLARIKPRPVEILLERERVQRRRDVAGRAWICVIPPGATDLVRLFQHYEIGDPSLAQFDRHSESAKSGSYDHGCQGLLRRRCAVLCHGFLLGFLCARACVADQMPQIYPPSGG